MAVERSCLVKGPIHGENLYCVNTVWEEVKNFKLSLSDELSMDRHNLSRVQEILLVS